MALPTDHADVVVVGSGGAALVAACGAAEAGHDVVVLERSPVLGGTTAVSGGMLWIGNHPLTDEAGITDSREETLTYLQAVTRGEVDPALLAAFVDTGPELVRFLLAETPVDLFPIDRPDYNALWAGAKPGGRVLDNRPLATAAHPGLHERVRATPHFPPLTYEERHRWRWPERFDHQLIAERRAHRVRTLGDALAAGLVAACDERGVRFCTGVRVTELLERNGRVHGVKGADADGGDQVWHAAEGVVLASGGFEWNGRMTASFLRGPTRTAVSPPWNTGDALVMGMRAGAALERMSEAWWAPTIRVPGETYDGQVMSRHVVDDLSLPGTILVNRAGERFANESLNYNDISKLFHVFDPAAYDYPHTPAWMVFDDRAKQRYCLATVPSSVAAPDWFHPSNSLAELADRVGADRDGLARTVAEFNRGAVDGVDRQFGRGQAPLDRYYGDDEHEPNPCLAPIATPPYYAAEIHPGLLGTKGGLLTDVDGRVIDHAGNRIAGLWAAGNTAASAMGPGYPGAGGSLGPLLTHGLRCGRALAAG